MAVTLEGLQHPKAPGIHQSVVLSDIFSALDQDFISDISSRGNSLAGFLPIIEPVRLNARSHDSLRLRSVSIDAETRLKGRIMGGLFLI